MAKYIIFVIIVLTTMILDSLIVECRSLPASSSSSSSGVLKIEESSSVVLNKLLRTRRHGHHGHRNRKPDNLHPTNGFRDEEDINNAVSKTLAKGVLCNVPEAMPGTKIPCSEGNYLVEWSPVENGAANINVYEVLDKVGGV